MKKIREINNSFGERFANKFSIGDLVTWKTWELIVAHPDQIKKNHIGVVLDLYTEERGTRDVAMARVLNCKSQLTSDILAMNLHMISKAHSNEQII